MTKKRTPRNYDGTYLPGKNLNDLLPRFMAEINQKKEEPREKVFKEWLDILGEKMGSMTEIISFLDGILTVKVKSSTLYSLLCQHEKPRLLRLLQKKFSIRDIKFRIG
jgi:hypothetical protein